MRLAKDHDEVMEHQDGDQRRQAEIGAAHAQRRQSQHHPPIIDARTPGNKAERDRRLIEIVKDAGSVGAESDQEGRTEIDFAGEAEQEVPRHGEDAEIIGDRQQAQDVARDVERQGRGEGGRRSG